MNTCNPYIIHFKIDSRPEDIAWSKRKSASEDSVDLLRRKTEGSCFGLLHADDVVFSWCWYQYPSRQTSGSRRKRPFALPRACVVPTRRNRAGNHFAASPMLNCPDACIIETTFFNKSKDVSCKPNKLELIQNKQIYKNKRLPRLHDSTSSTI